MTWTDELAPDAADRYQHLTASLSNAGLDPVIIELCRVRIGQLLGVASPDASTVGADAKLAAVSRWPTDDRFWPRERAALGFAEQFVLDPSGVTDEDTLAWRGVLSDAELATLTTAVAVFDASARCEIALNPETSDATATT